MTSISKRAREQASATAEERDGVKQPSGGVRRSDGASRWELLTELQGAYILIAELAESVEELERRVEREN